MTKPNGSGLKEFSVKLSGRSSIFEAEKKYERGFIIRPEQVLELFHDTQPGLPIPGDAKHQGIGVEDAGVDSQIQFYFTSVSNPTVHCFALKPEQFFRMLVNLADGLLPLDSELDGIEISKRFTVILLRIRSSHWPAPLTKDMPLYHLRYEFGKLLLVDPSKLVDHGERRIQIQ